MKFIYILAQNTHTNMKKIAILLTAVTTICLYSCTDSAEHKTDGTVENKDTMGTTPKMDDTMAAEPKIDSATDARLMMEYMTPGEIQKMIASWDGRWTDSMTMWMDPAAPPMTSVGTTDNSMILGGRYQQSIHKSMMMGMAFEGRGTLGYDNAAKKFVNTWIDNMGTGIMYSEGTWDDATKTLTLKGKMVNYQTGKDFDCRQTWKVVDDKHQVFEMYCTKGGKEMKNMEIHSSRK